MNRFLSLCAVLALGCALAQDALEDRFQRGYYQEHALKDLDRAVDTYRALAQDALDQGNRALSARARLREALCERQRGREVEAVTLLEGVVKEFADQTEVQAAAKDALAALGGPRRTLRVYDVTYLLTRAPEREPLGSLQVERPLKPVPPGSQGFSFEDEEVAPEGIALDPDTLESLIEENVAGGSWEGDARVEVTNGTLVVVHTAEVHREVEQLVARLHALRGRAVTFDVRTLLLSADAYASLKLGAAGARVLQPAQLAALDQALATQQALEVERRQVSTPNRVGTEAATPTRLDFVGRIDVNQTGVVPVLNPVVEAGTEATALWLRPTLVADGQHLLLELHARTSRWRLDRTAPLKLTRLGHSDGKPMPRLVQEVELDLPTSDYVALEETLLVESGRAVVAGGSTCGASLAQSDLKAAGLTWSEAEVAGARILHVIVPRVEAPKTSGDPPALGKGRRELRVYNVALIVGEQRDPSGDRLRDFVWDLGAEVEGRRTLELDVLVEMLQENLSPDSWEHPQNFVEAVGEDVLAVSQTPAVHASVKSFLSALERGSALTSGVALELLDLELAPARLNALVADAPASQRLTAEAVDALVAEDATRILRWGSGLTLSRAPLGLQSTTSSRYLSGVEGSSGGTGLTVSEVVQPLADVVTSGWSLSALPQVLRDGRVALHLDYRVDTLGQPRQADLGFATVDLPQVTSERRQASATLDPDQVLVVSSQVRAGRGRLVLVRVRVEKLLGE